MKYAVVSVGNAMAFIACGYYFADDLNRDELSSGQTWQGPEAHDPNTLLTIRFRLRCTECFVSNLVEHTTGE